MALESPSLVKQKAFNFIKGTSNSKFTPLWLNALREFFIAHNNKGNANLELLAFSEADADTGGGTALATAARNVYVVYVKKLNAATVNYVKLFDDATDDTTTTDQRLVIELDAANQETMMVFPEGTSYATGVVVTQHTTSEGTTDGSDGGDGFVIVGAD